MRWSSLRPLPISPSSNAECDRGSTEREPTEVDCSAKQQQNHMHSSLTNMPKRCIFFVIGIWFLEQYFIASLLHYGMIEKNPFEELNEAVLQQMNGVLPHINVTLDSLTQSLSTKRDSVGHDLAEQGAQAKFPIVMVPGFVTSGLEVWSGRDCAKDAFRQRLWAALSGAKSFLVERDCWKEHMMLDPITGNDPEGIHLRASEGFSATDYFIGNYWVWDKLFRNLAMVGYNPSNMVMQPYDWRLPFHLLETRDGYFTNLKYRIEAMHKTSGKKVVLATHSMGAMVVHHFFTWVTTAERHGGGGGGKKWVDTHIHCYINIAGSHLGVPKAATAILSGEMHDTVFGGRMALMVERFFGRRMRRELWSSWGSLWAMLPKGGDRLWGPGSDFCDERSNTDEFCPDSVDAVSPLISMTDMYGGDDSNLSGMLESSALLRQFISRQSHSAEKLIDFLTEYYNGSRFDNVDGTKQQRKGHSVGKAWYDATVTPLPYAPSMPIYCLYGVGLPTERAYYYKRNWLDDNNNNNEAQSQGNLTEPVIILDPTESDEAKGTRHGIRFSDGDGSVPLLSLGYMCADAWKRDDSGLNPSRSKVYTREYKHKPEFYADDPMRGGPLASDHVDILGNAMMMEDFIRIVTDFHAESVATDHIESDIRRIAADVNLHGGIFRQKRWQHKLNGR